MHAKGEQWHEAYLSVMLSEPSRPILISLRSCRISRSRILNRSHSYKTLHDITHERRVIIKRKYANRKRLLFYTHERNTKLQYPIIAFVRISTPRMKYLNEDDKVRGDVFADGHFEIKHVEVLRQH